MEGTTRILHVLGRLDRGGAETMVMNLYRHIDRSRMQFDFVIHTRDTCDYTEEIMALGGRIYSMVPFRASTALLYLRQWRRFFRAHPEYQIVHGHMRSTASLYLHEAKRAGCVTLVHSHNTSSGSGLSALIKNMLQYPLRFQADYLFACSRAAGVWLYGRRACETDRFHILYNGVEPERFRFREEVRQAKREELLPADGSAADALVFLHIGRLERQKNHAFLLQIMARIVKHAPGAVLWLCGVGPLEEQLRQQAKQYGIEGVVRFLGMRTDVPALMQAADVMVFPSLFEGLPVSLVEAQAAGLPVLMSDAVTEEVILTRLVHALPLHAGPVRWARAALAMAGGTRERPGSSAPADRAAYAETIGQSGYDATENAGEMTAFYEAVTGQKGRRVQKRRQADRAGRKNRK